MFIFYIISYWCFSSLYSWNKSISEGILMLPTVQTNSTHIVDFPVLIPVFLTECNFIIYFLDWYSWFFLFLITLELLETLPQKYVRMIANFSHLPISLSVINWDLLQPCTAISLRWYSLFVFVLTRFRQEDQGFNVWGLRRKRHKLTSSILLQLM